MPFACSICDQESTRICEFCTKDTCADHLCAECSRCSDCCECDVPLTVQPNGIPAVPDHIAPEPEPAPAELASITEEEARQPEAVPAQAPAPEPGAPREREQDPALEPGA
jgi:hypothetical protein